MIFFEADMKSFSIRSRATKQSASNLHTFVICSDFSWLVINETYFWKSCDYMTKKQARKILNSLKKRKLKY